ncbi:MAG: hypothetical protein PHF86_11230 [Candidatus Nanoarchaeia archaeon]|nr:hypothetical protein [Candidatus Nanoarchaeia archaeon]
MISEETKIKWEAKLNTIIEAQNKELIILNDWEKEFIDSIYYSIYKDKKELSFKQSSCLNKIYGRIE